MNDDCPLFTESLDFLSVVMRMRELPTDRYRSLAFHAACHWNDDKLHEHLDAAVAADKAAESADPPTKPLPPVLLKLVKP